MTHDALCYRSHDQPLGRDPFCQCDALRACEQRVRDEERGWEGAVVIARAGYEDGYAAALDAAREAVASMEIAVVGNSAATVDQALAVIESLRKGSND
jgi:hypothetical protein